MSWSFADSSHMSLPMGKKLVNMGLSRLVVVQHHSNFVICPIWSSPWAKNSSNQVPLRSRHCGKHISAGWIYTVRSSIELSEPGVVQHHGLWPWPLVVKVTFWKRVSLGVGWPINLEQKGYESIGSRTHFVIWTLTSPMTLTVDFKGQNLKKLHLRNGRVDWHGTKGMWVNRILDPLCDLEVRSWPWIFKVKFWQS